VYRAFFGMTSNPFRKDIPVSQLFESEDLRSFLARMGYFQQTLGVAVVYGRPGMGKTTALRAFVDKLNPQLFTVIYRPLTSLTVIEFYRGLCQGCGLEPMQKKVDMFQRLQEHIQNLSRKKLVPVFILDEAQFLSQAILNELRMILNFHMDSKDYAMLVLCGQNHFIGQLNLHGNEPLRQRISVHYEFQGLGDGEVSDYIETLLRHAGVTDPLFTSDALQALTNLCGGSPRLLDTLVEKALILGWQNKNRSLDAEIIRQAHQASTLFVSLPGGASA
jgi:type II secretory pathway predicted ATPase ExeA